jgi:thiamine-monophosphate kinase
MPCSINSAGNIERRNSRGSAMAKAGEQGSGEDRLIVRFFKPLATHPGALAFADDAAVLTPPAGCDLVLTTDAIVAGVHFFPDDPPGSLARKALRVNLSDLAAKGARPLGFLMSIALTNDTTDSWLSSFAAALQSEAVNYACPLLGGDTDRTPGPLSVTISAFGSLPSGTMVRRAGATPGDRVLVTGTVGDAALGLQLRRGAAWKVSLETREFLLSRYLVPQPRVALADALRAHASAAMDVSDGLVGDLVKLCRVSGVSASVSVPAVPLSDATKATLATDPAQLATVLTGGDDYEILCTVPPDRLAGFHAAAELANVPVTDIGVIRAGEGAAFISADSSPLRLDQLSYSHF